MTPERWQQVNELFHCALEREPAQRAAFLDHACDGDEELRKEVESLISSHKKTDSFIDAPALEAATQLLAEDKPTLALGQRIGRYKILSLLGKGGMGEVYLAQESKLGRKVALKILPASFTKDQERVCRFEQEARAASALNHPNILTVHDIEEVDGLHVIVTEYVEGETLRDHIADRKLQLIEALDLSVQVVSALSAAHQAGIVHRDIKPENIMLRRDGYVKVLDFGLAKLAEQKPASSETQPRAFVPVKTDTGVVIGTVSYMSPEQAMGRPVDQRSDVFSFGVVFYEMLTGEQAFRRDSDVDTMHAIIHDEPAGLSGLRVKVPIGVERVMRRCLEKAPEQRYVDGGELVAALKEALDASHSKGWSPGLDVRFRLRQRWWVALIAGALIVAGALAPGIVKRAREVGSNPIAGAPLPPMKVVPFTSYPGEEYMPSFSPDGNLIAFQWNGEKGGRDFSIYVKQSGSEKALRLTFDAANDIGPVWSADGQRIAFYRITKSEFSIFIVPALGGAARKLLTVGPNMSFGRYPTLAWSPDGKFIAFVHKEPKEESAKIFLVSPDTLERQSLTSPPAGTVGDFNPAFSPDGQSVAFARYSSIESSDIYVAPISGGEPRRLTFANAQVNGLDWTADGREIVFSSNRSWEDPTLWRIPASGGAAERVAVDAVRPVAPNISRHGNRLTYVQASYADVNIYRVEVSDTAVSKNPPTKFIASTRHDGGPQYSPDGRKIAFHSDRSGHMEIWMCDADGTNLVQLTSLNKRSGLPRWSPDGQQIVFDVYEDTKGDIYAVSVEGGLPHPIVTDAADDHLPSWSADGKWIYFTSDRTGIPQVWKVPAEGGEAVQVTRGKGLFPRESPDGMYVYYSKFQGAPSPGLWRVSADTGEETQVLDSSKSELGTVVNDGIYFINSDAKDGVALEFFDFATGKERRVAELGTVNTFPLCVAVSPDRRHILYTQNDYVGADIMLVENFR